MSVDAETDPMWAALRSDTAEWWDGEESHSRKEDSRHLAAVSNVSAGVRAWRLQYRQRIIVADGLCALLVGMFSVLVSVPFRQVVPIPYVLITLISPAVWILMVAACHGYDRRYLGIGTEEYRAMVSAAIRLLALVGFLSYALYTGRPYLSRAFVCVYFPVLLATAILARHALRAQLHHARRCGRACHRAVVVGRPHAVRTLVTELQHDPIHGILPVAVCTDVDLRDVTGVEHAGPIDSVIPTISRTKAEVVLVANPSGLNPVQLRRLSWKVDDLGVELIVAPGVVEVMGPRMAVRPAGNLSLLHIERPAMHGVSALAKSAFDRTLAMAFLIMLCPVLVTVAILVKIRDRGSVFFRQQRVGVDGSTFTMLKFRSMVPDAEQQLAAVSADADDGNGILFKRKDDPRVTPIGRVLRRYSLDELPQLLNVVRGDMSLVGPRPPLPSEAATYGLDAWRRMKVKPGVTGLWQVSGRSDLSWGESLRLDLRYVDNWSLVLDIQILWRTLHAVLRGDGAY